MKRPRLAWLCAALLSVILPLSVSVLHPCSTVAQAARTVGTDGRDGQDGQAGRQGRNGPDRTVRATQNAQTIEMRGEDGDDGYWGSDATHPVCRNHRRPSHDVQAADGGDGGDGGRGGSGGHGGNLTVYYEDLDRVRNLYVRADGGRGGRGGSGGRGTDGCNCNEDTWEAEICSDGNCRTEHYRCTDGKDGRNGRFGSNGADGGVGQARLIGQRASLPGDRPRVESAIATLPTTPIDLSLNLWETRTGAKALFADGSVISDRYEIYQGRIERQFQLLWASDLAQDRVAGDLVLTVNDRGDLDIDLPEDLWFDAERTDSGTLTTYRVRSALLRSEALQLAFGRPSGSGEQFELSILDRAGLSDVIETRFHLRYRVEEGERRPRYRTRYEADIPSELIQQNHNRFTVKLADLPIDREYLQTGSSVRVELVVTRTYAGNSAEQTLSWNGQL
ncbi:MAG: collagen-like protein [Cyanobacteria bacterium P01_D01_bin.14]